MTPATDVQEDTMATVKPLALNRSLNAIAHEIWADFKDKPMAYAAEPYIDALYGAHTTDLSESYGADDYAGIVNYLVNSNLGTWRGETARRVKAELRAALAHHQLNRHLPSDREPVRRGRR
jgi:hypothetical protein